MASCWNSHGTYLSLFWSKHTSFLTFKQCWEADDGMEPRKKDKDIYSLLGGGGDNQPCGNMLDSREMTAQQTNTGSYSAVCQLVAAAVLAAPFQQWKNMHAGWNSIVVFCWLMQWFKPTVSIKSINNICSLYSYEEKKSLLVTKIP